MITVTLFLTIWQNGRYSYFLKKWIRKCKTQDAAYMNIYAIKQICEIVYILATECCMKREKFEATSSESFQRFEHVLNYVHENYSSNLKTSEVAERFFFSKEYFCRLFKKIQVWHLISMWHSAGLFMQNNCLRTQTHGSLKSLRRWAFRMREVLSLSLKNIIRKPLEIIEKW